MKVELLVCLCFWSACVIGALIPVSPEEESKLKEYARFSSIASCVPSGISRWNCGSLCDQLPGVSVLSYFDSVSTDGVGYVAQRGNELLIVFRCSTTSLNWIYNLQVFQEQVPWNLDIDPYIRVHRGFFETYSSIQADVRKAVKANYKEGLWVTFTGHSLGGALATLALCDLVENGLVPVQNSRLITFGSPRIGNATWASYFQKRFASVSTRVVHQRDVVPHLPPMNPVIPYFQVAREWWFTYSKTRAMRGWKCSVNNSEDPLCSDQFDYYTVDDHFSFLGIVFGCAPQIIPIHWGRTANF